MNCPECTNHTIHLLSTAVPVKIHNERDGRKEKLFWAGNWSIDLHRVLSPFNVHDLGALKIKYYTLFHLLNLE